MRRNFASLSTPNQFESAKAQATSDKAKVVPLSLICILVALFSIQRFGTAAVGGTFGKIMFLWLKAAWARLLPRRL
jgi:K+ transporter